MTNPPVRQLALGDLAHELAQTRRILERVPADRFTWKPHDKSYSLGSLARHISELPFFALIIATQDDLDVMKGLGREKKDVKTTDDLLTTFDEGVAKLTAAIDGTDDARMLATFTMRRGDHVILAAPRFAALRSMGISHLVHHRGQLSVYLREVGAPVPGMYGPSADER